MSLVLKRILCVLKINTTKIKHLNKQQTYKQNGRMNKKENESLTIKTKQYKIK